MFEELLESGRHKKKRSLASFAVSIAFHSGLLGLLIVLPLLYYEVLPRTYMLTTMPPPRPSPPEPPPAPPAQPKPEREEPHSAPPLVLPDYVPDRIPAPPDDVLHLVSSVQVENPGGGIPSNVVGEGLPVPDVVVLPSAPPPPPAPRGPKQPLRVSVGVQTSKLVYRPKPVYPRMAKLARVEGVVELQSIVDETGKVTELKVISGNDLLRQAALDAVRQWRYTPTLLNGEPVPVITRISITFRLGRER